MNGFLMILTGIYEKDSNFLLFVNLKLYLYYSILTTMSRDTVFLYAMYLSMKISSRFLYRLRIKPYQLNTFINRIFENFLHII